MSHDGLTVRRRGICNWACELDIDWAPIGGCSGDQDAALLDLCANLCRRFAIMLRAVSPWVYDTASGNAVRELAEHLEAQFQQWHDRGDLFPVGRPRMAMRVILEAMDDLRSCAVANEAYNDWQDAIRALHTCMKTLPKHEE